MRVKDWGHIVSVLGVCLLLICGCDGRSDEGLSSDGPDAVYLDINVALRDAPVSGRSVSGRADEDPSYDKVTNAEKMQTLRVILVRPDGRVEHNVYLDLKNAPVSDRYGKIRLKVQGNEEKTIYLLGNETSVSVELPAVEGETSRVFQSWGDFKPGDKFLTREQMAGLVLSFDNVGTFNDTHPLPMSECHTVMLTDEGLKPDDEGQGQAGEEGEKVVLKKKEITLKITRAAAKFTYEITNKSSRDYWLSGIRIEKSASHEYLLPNGMKYDDAENEVTDFQVPASAEYTSFNQSYGEENVKLEAKSTAPVKLSSFYLLEGKYENADDVYSANMDGKNYKTSYKTAITLDTKDNSGIDLGGNAGSIPSGSFTLEDFFPNLSTLPRNTHVVVKITIGDADDISWQVDLRPYSEVILEPGFGLDI